MLGPLSFKLRAFLAKQVSQEFMHSFLGLMDPGNHPFLHRAAPPSGIVSGLNQVWGAGSQEIRRLFTDRKRTQAITKLRGEGPSPLFYSPLSPSLMDFPSRLYLSYIVPPFRNLTRHWLLSHLPGSRQGEWSKGGRGCTPARRISFVSLVAYGPKVFLLSLSHGGLQLLKPGWVVLNKVGFYITK